jgi:putative ABC transport system substrate-binding protein
VTHLNRPEGNLTGVTAFFGEVTGKRLQLLRQMVPAATLISVLVNPDNPLRLAADRDTHPGSVHTFAG